MMINNDNGQQTNPIWWYDFIVEYNFEVDLRFYPLFVTFNMNDLLYTKPKKTV